MSSDQPPYHAYPPPYTYPYVPPRPTNGMAIAALILGVVGACNPLGVLGLIFGTIARRQIRETGEQGDGMAVAGIVLGWIGVASIVFWALYVVFFVTTMSTVFDRLEDYSPSPGPTDFPTWILDVI